MSKVGYEINISCPILKSNKTKFNQREALKKTPRKTLKSLRMSTRAWFAQVTRYPRDQKKCKNNLLCQYEKLTVKKKGVCRTLDRNTGNVSSALSAISQHETQKK
jgi:hypothetical protein